MKRENALHLQFMALEIKQREAKRDRAIKELVSKRGLSYAALRRLRNPA
jgi:hypothetical protein